jgi:large subunit ribosomal protein L18
MKQILLKNKRRLRRRHHVRSRIRRESTTPRLSIQRSLKHFYGQVIDDSSGRTLVHVASTSRSIREELAGKRKTEQAKVLGAELARRAREAGVQRVVFDRGHAKYHGRVKAFADAAREGGLEF